ncbi:ATP-binding protein [Terracidiphilus gabretensis]|jgi:anti-sigma regulatory factor (Ser/Thr protein kinase)|uniref:ATP-binding protein n=1 Tax=Terracidiphilus gabretensis TaxID=1577687 RepID=UPI00071BF9E1|nr:ATP-binding protein [Terracidiphilus gabretensis]
MTDRSSVGEARRAALAAAQSLGFSESRRNDVGIAVTEAATNIVLHANTGEFLICAAYGENSSYLDLLALDSGAGIYNVPQAFEDGYSTVGTAGQGLGAVQRLSDVSSLYSLPNRGTIFWSRFQTGTTVAPLLYGAVSIPMKGEAVCGDGFLALPGKSRSLYMMVDGLGHGAHAAEAAKEAVQTVGAHAGESATEIIAITHDALKKTRGAAMSVVLVDHERHTLTSSGIGNISTVIVQGATTRNVVSQNGTLGAVLPRIQEFTYPFDPRSMLLMHSDGVGTKWSLASYPGLQARHPQLIAGLLYRDFSRHRDDASVLLASLGGEAA